MLLRIWPAAAALLLAHLVLLPPAQAAPLNPSQVPTVTDLFALARWESSAVASTDCSQLPDLAPAPASFAITCDDQGYVTALNMSNLGLQGSMPNSLRNLVALQSLDMRQNGLEGSIPGAALGSLRSLKYINLRRNLLTNSIPDELAALSNLNALYLGYNKLSDTLPPSLGALTNLAAMVLRKNDIGGGIPTQWSALTALTALDLGYNQLSGSYPDALSTLASLQILSLGSNHLSGPMPGWLGSAYSGLKILDVSSNQISSSIPASLGGAPDLIAVSLDNNQLEGSLPASMGALTNLQFLYAVGNKLNGSIPPSWAGMVSLRALDLSNNAELGNATAVPEWVDALMQLQSIRLESCSFQGVLPPGVGHLALLQELILRNNYLSGNLPASLCALPHLQSVDVAGNALTGPIPPCLPQAPGLLLLSVGNNLLSGDAPTSANSALDFQYDGNCLNPPAAAQRLLSSPECAATDATPATALRPPAAPGSSPPTPTPTRPGLGSILQMGGGDDQFPHFFFSPPQGQGADGTGGAGDTPDGLSVTSTSSPVLQQSAEVPPPPGTQTALLSASTGPGGSSSEETWYGWLKVTLIVMLSLVVLVLLCAVAVLLVGPAVKNASWPSVNMGMGMGMGMGMAPATPYMDQVPVTEYGLSKMKKATKNFSTLLGKGSFGTTLLAEDFLRDQIETRAVVKRAGDPASLGEFEFRAKVEELARARHPCCVNLLGYCTGKSERILVFEYMPNGTLFDRLHRSEMDPLPWEARVRIAVNVACALEFLHSSTPPLVHRAVTSSNILLTADMSAKLSDYGLARGGGSGMENAPKRRRPTRRGGAAPSSGDASQSGHGSSSGDVEAGRGAGVAGEKEQQHLEKVDVYGFGVVLLELMTGQKAMKDVHITSLAAPFLEDAQMMPLMVDAALGGYFNQAELVELGSLARDCVQEDPSQRPSMREVVAHMEAQLNIDLQLYHSLGEAADLAAAQAGAAAAVGGPLYRGAGYSALKEGGLGGGSYAGAAISAVSSAASSFRSLLGGVQTSSAPPTPGGSTRGPGSEAGDTDSTTSSTLLFITPKK